MVELSERQNRVGPRNHILNGGLCCSGLPPKTANLDKNIYHFVMTVITVDKCCNITDWHIYK